MPKWLSIYLIIELAIVVFAIASFFVWGRRYRKNHGTNVPAGFEKTPEATLDPKSGKKQTIYFNPATGERFYREET